MDALDAAVEQRPDDRARRAAGAEDDRLPGAIPPAGDASSSAAMKPIESEFVDRNRPFSNHIALAAPIARARSSGSVSLSAISLCGIVAVPPT